MVHLLDRERRGGETTEYNSLGTIREEALEPYKERPETPTARREWRRRECSTLSNALDMS